ncbi:MAG: ribonuclease III [Actinomycetota bacterium]
MVLLTVSNTELSARLGVSTENEMLLVALTHSSYAKEHHATSNERLEFLGDAIVDLIVAQHLYSAFPTIDEGEATIARSQVVNEAALARFARVLDLGSLLRVNKGVEREGGRERDSILADAFEAVIAAVYLERGLEHTTEVLLSLLGQAIAEAVAHPMHADPKAQLRKWSESNGKGQPTYEVTADGPSHAVQFVAQVLIGGEVIATGQGTSRKSAEAQAALTAWNEKSNE